MACFSPRYSTTPQHVELLLTKCQERFSTSHKAFRHLDESNNGYVTAADLEMRFRRMGVELSPADAAAVVSRRVESPRPAFTALLGGALRRRGRGAHLLRPLRAHLRPERADAAAAARARRGRGRRT